MPYHTNSVSKPVKKEKKQSEVKKPSKSAMRKLTDKEKDLLTKHFATVEHSKAEKARMRMKLMRSKEVKSMKGLSKLHEQIFKKEEE